MRSSTGVFFIVAVLLLGTGASRAGDHEPHHAALLAYIEAWNSGTLALDEIVTPDFQRHAGPDESCNSRSELQTLIRRTHQVWKTIRISVDDSMATASGGAVRGKFYGVHRQTRGIIEFETMNMVRFEEGRIAEEWVIGDNFLSLMALGYELVPPGFETVPPVASPPADDLDSGEAAP